MSLIVGCQCRYYQAWNNVFRETLQSSATSASSSGHRSKNLHFVISRILEWEALDDVTALQDTLNQVAGSSLGMDPSDIQQAANTCLQKIQAMPPFSLL
jgi:hypothetical protein